jgi:hypothetical protein
MAKRGFSCSSFPKDIAGPKAILLSATVFAFGAIITDEVDIPQLVLAMGGGIVLCAFLQWYENKHKRPRKKIADRGPTGQMTRRPPTSSHFQRQWNAKPMMEPSGNGNGMHHRPNRLRGNSALPPIRQESKVPVSAPSFQANTFEDQVDELIQQIAPNYESDQIAIKLAECAKKAIIEAFPEMDVIGYANADVLRGTAFGVAVPEVGFVMRARHSALVEQLRGRLSKCGLAVATLDSRKLHKAAIRVCTELLVSAGKFKFRRSAFRGDEPKVTLMAPPELGISSKGIPVDFSVNSLTPLYNVAILNKCGIMDPRAKGLILLVRRWAKDRGVCHASKGHLAPYAWTLLAVYFMQVGLGNYPLLPPLKGLDEDKSLAVGQGDKSGENGEASIGVGQLFKQFVNFYAREVDWSKEAVSVRSGRRAPATISLMLHIVLHGDETSEVGPTIEDPFEPTKNLGSGLTSDGMQRMREELWRASAMMEGGDLSLSALLEPWAPPVRSNPQEATSPIDEEDNAEGGEGAEGSED